GLDLKQNVREAFTQAYQTLSDGRNNLSLLLTTYFEGLRENTELACSLPVNALHIDLIEAPDQLENVINHLGEKTKLSLGLIDGRNIWKADLEEAKQVIKRAEQELGPDRLMIAPSCSLLHCPVDLGQENDEEVL